MDFKLDEILYMQTSIIKNIRRRYNNSCVKASNNGNIRYHSDSGHGEKFQWMHMDIGSHVYLDLA